MEEKWKPIRGYYGWYEVSNLGWVRSKDGRITTRLVDGKEIRVVWKGRIMKQRRQHRRNYSSVCDPIVSLTKNGQSRHFLVSRLVAKAFCPGYRRNLTVNHKDGNPTNNRADNLEWVSMNENIQKSIESGRLSWYQECVLIFPDGSEVRYPSTAHASRAIGRAKSYISNRRIEGRPILTVDGREVKFIDNHRGHQGETESHNKDPG